MGQETRGGMYDERQTHILLAVRYPGAVYLFYLFIHSFEGVTQLARELFYLGASNKYKQKTVKRIDIHTKWNI